MPPVSPGACHRERRDEMNGKASEKKYKTHTFKVITKWHDGKTWEINTGEADTIRGGSPSVFGGEPGRWSPEELMLASVDSCHQSSFISLCRRKDFEFVSYESENEGLLEHDGEKFRFTKMTLRPRIGVKSEDDIERAKELIHKSHKGCFMSNSVNSEVTIEEEVFVAGTDESG
jgi:organic hydroperoxide reductase OsmC/OhrA